MKTFYLVLLSLAAGASAQAHAFLERAQPPVGNTVKVAPAEVSLWFTESLEGAFSSVKVFEASGREIDKKNGRVDANNDRRMSVSLPAGLGPGEYKVQWRAVAKDTHVTHGEFTFTVTP